jgi:hypothetical protein
VVVPDRDRAIVYRYYRTESPPAAARRAWPRRAMAACRRAGEEALGRRPAAAARRLLRAVAAGGGRSSWRRAAPGYGYVRVDNDVLLMDMTNRMVADAVNDLNDYDGIGSTDALPSSWRPQ